MRVAPSYVKPTSVPEAAVRLLHRHGINTRSGATGRVTLSTLYMNVRTMSITTIGVRGPTLAQNRMGMSLMEKLPNPNRLSASQRKYMDFLNRSASISEYDPSGLVIYHGDVDIKPHDGLVI